MPSPFPGMNPYLEHPEIWRGFHTRLMVAIADSLIPQLRPKYWVAIKERTYRTSGEDIPLWGISDVAVQRQLSATNPTIPNVAVASPPVQPVKVIVPMPEIVKEGYLEVLEVATKEVVTVIEVLYPNNKLSGEGRRVYLLKRQRVLGSFQHLVEIDLLRDGEPMPIFSNGIQSDYRILVSREERRPQADLYAFNLQNAIPSFPLPLRSGDVEPLVDLQTLLCSLYNRAGYDLALDYTREPVPPLKESDAAWVDALLREQGLRNLNP